MKYCLECGILFTKEEKTLNEKCYPNCMEAFVIKENIEYSVMEIKGIRPEIKVN